MPVRQSAARQSRQKRQRVPIPPLDAPANAPTSEPFHDRLATGSQYEQDKRDITNVPSKNLSAAKTMAVNRNGAHIETEPRVGRSKRKAKVLVESESEGEITYVSFSLITRYTSKVLFPCSGLFFQPRSHHQRRHVNNPSRLHVDSFRQSSCKNCGFNN